MRKCFALLSLLLLTACGLGEFLGSGSRGGGGPNALNLAGTGVLALAQIEIHAMEPTIHEGENARFRIGWYGVGVEPDSDLTVNLSVSQFENYTSTFPTSITLTEENNFRNILEIPTIDDNIVEPIGNIIVELLPGDGYSIFAFEKDEEIVHIEDSPLEADNLALRHVKVMDNEPPRIDIHVHEPTISEGGIARFSIGWYGFGARPEPGLSVNLHVTQSGSYTKTFPSSITLNEENGIGSVLEIPTIDDGNAERNGKITVKLRPGLGYTIYDSNVSWRTTSFENWGITSVDVLDNDQPRISISAESYPVVEGNPANFIIKSETTVPASDLTVNIITHLVGNFFPQPAPTEFALKAGRQSGVLSIPTVADMDSLKNGGIMVGIKPGSGYVLADLTRTYTSVMVVGDSVPTIWVEAVNPTIPDGELAEFTIGSETGALEEDLTVNISVTRNGGDFLYSTDIPNLTSINTFLLEKGKVSDKLSFSTGVDDLVQNDWKLGLQIHIGDGYQLSGRYFAFIDIIVDNSVPVWIETPKSEIYEGEVASFLVGIGTGDSPQTIDRVVNLNVRQTGSFIAGQMPSTVNLKAGKGSEVLEIPTVYDDSTVSQDGNITVEILSGVGYAVASNSSATITVKDRETQPAPTLLVAAIRDEIDEGQPALFRIVADVSRLVSPLTVHFTIQEQGDFLDQVYTEILPSAFKMEPGRTFLGRAAGTHGFSTEDDINTEDHGAVTLTLQNSVGYQVMQGHDSATVRIRDNDGSNFRPAGNDSTSDDNYATPRIGISSTLRSVVYGLELPFRITSASNRLLPEGLTVTLNVQQIYESQEVYEYSQDVVLEGNQRSEDVRLTFVPTTFNIGSGAKVEVSIADSAEYNVHAGQNIASILVIPKSQDQYSVIGFVQDVNIVTEGETAKIGVTITNNTVGFIVKMKVTEIGEFLNLDLEDDTLIVTVPPYLTVGAYMPIPIPDNDTIENDGSVTFEILPGTGYRVDPQNSTTTLHIHDNDQPEVFVESSSQNVDEGEQAVFTIGTEGNAFANSGLELEILLRITQQGDFLLNAPPDSFILGSGKRIDYLRLDTVDDSLNEVNGLVTVEINARSGSNYGIKQGFQQASLEIRDNDTDWTVSLNKLSNFVYEGDSANFEISRIGTEYTKELRVSLRSNTVGDFLLNAPPESFTIRPGRETEILGLETRSDELVEPNGQVSIELLPGQGYGLHENTTLQTIEILDSSQPLPVFVAKLDYFVHEGESANFVIGSEDAAAPRDLEILLEVFDPQGFLSNEAPEKFSLKKGTYTSRLELETEDDKILESDGWITVIILKGAGYQPIEGSKTDSIEIRDNESKPEIHVRALSETAFAGEKAEFEIGVAGDAPISDLIIRFWEDRQIGQFSYGSYVNWDLPKGTKLTYYRPTGYKQISVTLITGIGYTVSEAESKATVNFVTKPTVTVSADGSSSVEEGNSVSFEIRRSGVSPRDTVVNVNVTSAGDFLEGSAPESVSIPSSENSALLTLDTTDDNINEGDGHVELKILNGTGYYVGTEHTARIAVNDNDPKPELSIEALRSEVGKGDTVRFRISATTVSVSELSIYYVLNDSENMAVGPTVTSILLEAGKETIEFEIPTNENANGQGSFTVGLAQTTEYDIHDLLNMTVVHVYDWPLIGVEAAHAMPLTEGSQAAFRLISRENRPVPLTVSYTISQTDVSGTRALTESFSAGQNSQTFQVSTGDDNIYTHVSQISVELQPGYGYRVSDQYHQRTSLPISDNDKPTISVESKMNGSIKEGDTAVFAVNATNASSTDLQINLRVEKSGGNFLLRPRSTATLPAGQTSAHFSVQTHADMTSESDGRVSVEVIEGLGYDAALPNSNSAGVDVANVARPLLFLVRERHSVRSGEDAVFTVKAVTTTDNGSIRSISLANDLVISTYGTRSTNAFNISDFDSWTLPAGQSSLKIRIPTGNWNSISISLIAFSEGAYGLYERYETAGTITVTSGTDDNGSAAPVSVSISGSDPIVEGTGRNAVFRLTADRPATTDLTINLEVTGALNFFEIANIPDSVELKAGSDTAILEIPVHDDGVDDADGKIMVEILNPANAGEYGIGAPGTAKVVVKDDETPPTVSIAGSASAVEGSDATAVFTFTASKAASNDRNIHFSVSGASDFLPSIGIPSFVTLSGNETTATIELEIVDDDIDESSDVLTVTIQPPASIDDYWVGDTKSASTTIEDNDTDLLVTIASDGDAVEGNNTNLSFTVTARKAETFERTIGLTLVEGAPSFIENDDIPSEINLPANNTVARVEIPLQNDDVDEADDTFRIKIAPSPTGQYEIFSGNVARATISDDDLPPSVSIVTPTDPADLVEGTDENVRIAFQATGRASDARVINLSIAGADSYFQPGSIPASVTLAKLSNTTHIDIPIHDDEVEDLDATLSIGILPPNESADYQIGATSTFSLNLTDPVDSNPNISISDAESVVESVDSHAVFTITSSKQTSASRQINLSVTGATNFITQGSVPTYEEFPSGVTEKKLLIPIHDDNVYETNGAINVEITEHTTGSSYLLGTNSSASVNVTDNDPIPRISIAGPASFVEGSVPHHIEFTLSVKTMFASDMTVPLSVTGAENFVTPNSEIPDSTVFAANTLQSTFQLPIHDDAVEDSSSIISVTVSRPIIEDSYALGIPQMASVHVLDDESTSDWPVISIKRKTQDQSSSDPTLSEPNPSILEGTDETIEFTLLSSKPVPSGLYVKISVTGATEFLDRVSYNVEFPSGTTQKNFPLDIVDDRVYDDPGNITVTVLGPFIDGGYLVGNQKSVQVAIKDNESVPVINPLHAISAREGTNDFIYVLFITDKPFSSPRTVNLSVSGATNYLITDSIPSSFEFSANRNFHTLKIPVEDDNEVEQSPGIITVTILKASDSKYSVGKQDSITLEIQDDDGTTSHRPSGISLGTINDGSSTAKVPQDTLIDDQPDAVPVVSISAKLSVIHEGSVAEFQISMSQKQPVDMTINLTINFANGSDVTTSQDRVVLRSGEKTASYAVRTQDDSFAGEDWTVSVGIASGNGYETDDTANVATVTVSDEIDRTRRDGIAQANSVVLPALLERIGSGPISNAFRRVEQNFAGNTQSIKVGGQNSLKDMILKGGKLANDEDIPWESLLDGSSFNIPVSNQDGIAGSYSIWGSGERHNAIQSENSFKWNGDLMIGQLGFDAQFNEGYLAGLSVTRSEAEATYDSNEGSVLEYDTDSTGLYPYFGWESTDRNSQLQVAAGYSEGGIVVNQDGFEPYYMDSSLFSAGIGGNATLFATESNPLERTSELNLIGEAWFARQNLDGQYDYLEDRRLEAGFSRMALENTNQFDAGAGATFQPTASFGVLGRTGGRIGFELGSSMSYVNPIGLDVTAEGRSFLATDGRAKDIKLSGKVEFDMERDGLGVILSLSPVWNHNPANGQNSVWTSEVSEFGTETVQFGTSSQFNAKIGYGLDLWSHAGLLTPFGEVRLTESVQNELALGSKYESDSGLEFGFEWSGSNSFDSGTSQSVKAKSSLKW